MRLLKAHIDAFGSFKNADFDFDEDLHVYFGGNGKGKSTLSDFVLACLYGMKTVNKNAAGFKPREHYLPYGEKSLGGTLTLEEGGDIYRIERTFGEKSSTGDTTRFTCNGQAVQLGLDVTPGLYLLGYNEESFLKTAYLSSGDLSIGTGEEIRNKLTAHLTDTKGFNGYEAAMKLLGEKRKEIGSTRSSNGQINLLRKREAELSRALEEIAMAEKERDGLEASLAEEEKKGKELESRIVEIENGIVLRKDYSSYLDKLADIERAGKRSAEILAAYGGRLPKKEDLDRLCELDRQREKKAALLWNAALGKPEEDELEALSRELSGISLNGETMAKLRVSAKIIDDFKAKYGGITRDSVDDKTKQILSGFAGKADVDGDYARLSDLLDGETAPKAKKGNAVYAVGPILSAALLIAGVVLLALSSFLAGGILLVAGVLGLFVSGFLYLLRRSSGANKKDIGLAAAAGLLSSYGYRAETDVRGAFASFKADREAYRVYLEEEKRLEEAKRDFGPYKDAFDVSSGYVYGLSQFEKKSERYKDLFGRNESDRMAKAGIAAEIASIRKETESVLFAYGKKPEDLAAFMEKANKDLQELSFIRSSIEDKKKEAEDFKARHCIPDTLGNVDENEEKAKLDSLKQQKQALDKTIAGYNASIGAKEAVIAGKADVAGELADVQGKKKGLEHELELVRKSEDMLTRAHDDLVDRYLKPLKNSFATYQPILENLIGYTVGIKGNLDVSLSKNGHGDIDCRHLSLGEMSLVTFCFRLALIENIELPGKRPFLLLDDPFVHLDDSNIKKAMQILHGLKGKYQVLYFTCSSARKP